MVPEARLEDGGAGLVPASRGWFVLNARDARWFEKPGQGHSLPLTGHDEYEAETFFPMLGMAIRVVNPGEPTTTYHWDTEQEDFLVLAGEGLLVVEGQERPVRQWDFVHCPPETRHTFVGAGDRPCAPVCELASVPEGRAVGLLLRRRDGRALQREPAGGHTGR
jgi:mannose-6-phosphate isomerase-like protein (cupin superfamily)